MFEFNVMPFDSLDDLCIVDKDYRVIYDSRYESMIHEGKAGYSMDEIIGKNFFDVFSSLNKENSTVVHCMKTGKVIAVRNQKFIDYKGREFITDNITVPMLKRGEIIAVVEFSVEAGKESSEGKNINDIRFNSLFDKIIKKNNSEAFSEIITVNKDMLNTIEKAKKLAQTNSPTLIYGETGTGKELFAQSIMKARRTPDEVCIVENCAAIPENLFESILFGTVKGAYTGAENRVGLFEQANEGVLFLDEINSMPYSVQAKLLRVIQNGKFRPVGAKKEKSVQVKLITAMNVPPEEAINKKILRADLFYRLSSVMILIPPLRERPEDIEVFLNHYIKVYSDLYQKEIKGISKSLKQFIYSYAWNGNVRELKNMVESMVSLTERKVLSENDLPEYLKDVYISRGAETCQDECYKDETYKTYMEYHEKDIIKYALKKSLGNRTRAAKLLDLPRQTFNYKARKYNL